MVNLKKCSIRFPERRNKENDLSDEIQDRQKRLIK